jgi:hypothetical protein
MYDLHARFQDSSYYINEEVSILCINVIEQWPLIKSNVALITVQSRGDI